MNHNATCPPPPQRHGTRAIGAAGKATASCRFAAAAFLALLLCAHAASAATSAQCESAALSAARLTGVPVEVLTALALTESGRARSGRLRPWPWTVNMAGDGQWFDSRDSAIAHVRTALGSGKRNVDIGCFQINHRWHANAFDSLDQMFDPQANALYAARFLNRLKAEFGSWEQAAGAYHSRTPELAARYIARFRSHLQIADVRPGDGTHAGSATQKAAPPPPRQPATAAMPYPLLTGGAAPVMGSLVPTDAVASRGGLLTAAAGRLQ